MTSRALLGGGLTRAGSKTAFLLVALLVPMLQVLAQVERVPRELIEQRIEDATEPLGEDPDVDLTNLFERVCSVECVNSCCC